VQLLEVKGHLFIRRYPRRNRSVPYLTFQWLLPMDMLYRMPMSLCHARMSQSVLLVHILKDFHILSPDRNCQGSLHTSTLSHLLRDEAGFPCILGFRFTARSTLRLLLLKGFLVLGAFGKGSFATEAHC